MSADELDRTLRAWVDERDLSGTVLVTRAGEPVFEGSYGYADRSTQTPNTPATRFALASVTKLFTAVAVADLVAAGRLTFDTPVVSVLPSSRRPSTLLDSVTVHHLLCHTSGIADYCEEDEDSPFFLEDYGSLLGRAAVVLDRAAGRLPAPVPRPAAVPRAGAGVAVLQRRLHRARAGDRGGDRSALRRGRAGARLRPCRHDGERVLPSRRRAPRRRRRLPAAGLARRRPGARTSTASPSSVAPTAARTAPLTTSTGSSGCSPTAPCSVRTPTLVMRQARRRRRRLPLGLRRAPLPGRSLRPRRRRPRRQRHRQPLARAGRHHHRAVQRRGHGHRGARRGHRGVRCSRR